MRILQAQAHYEAGRIAEAEKAAKKAKQLNIAGVIIGPFIIAAVIILIILVLVL